MGLRERGKSVHGHRKPISQNIYEKKRLMDLNKLFYRTFRKRQQREGRDLLNKLEN